MVPTPTILRRIALGIVLASPAALHAQAGTWAITNARIETVTKGVIEKGTIVIRDGLITAVGADVPVPADARVLDYAKRTVSPGLIDLTSSLGLPAAPAPAPGGFGGGGGGRGGAAPAPTGGRSFSGFDPDRNVASEIELSSSDAKAARDAGVTAVLVAPQRGALRGLSALIPTRDSVKGFDAIRTNVAEHFGFSGGGFGGGGGVNNQGERLPGTIMGVIAYQRQALYDAKRHGVIVDRWKADPRGVPRPDNDPELESLVPVVRGALPVFYEANVENEIRRAQKVAKEFGLKFTIVGATEGWRALDALKGSPVVVSVNFPTPTQATGWSYYQAERHTTSDSVAADKSAKAAIEANAAALHKAGIGFALASGGQSGASFVAGVKKAIAAGLPADVALQASTIRAAELAGLDKALGSIEVGKLANLVVTENGGIFGDSARVRAVFVDGHRYDVAAAPAAPPGGGGRGGRGGGAGGAGAASETAQLGGTWRMTIDSPQGVQAVTMTVNQSGGTFTGRISGLPTGDLPVTDGVIAGSKATWSAGLTMGAQTLTLNFSGDVTGTKINGTIALGAMGNATFTGDKTP
jgi:imidazolonepropionase-like amidohydrolase